MMLVEDGGGEHSVYALMNDCGKPMVMYDSLDDLE
jgi:hypothetical protein